MVFHWKSLRRQIRVRGPIETVSDAEADAYFETRARGSRNSSPTSPRSSCAAGYAPPRAS